MVYDCPYAAALGMVSAPALATVEKQFLRIEGFLTLHRLIFNFT